MFGIDDILLMSLIGGGLGAATSKKPLQGALLGAGMGYGGGLLAAPGGAAAAAGGTGMGLLDPITAAEIGAQVSTPSAMQTAMGMLKPVGQAASAANAVKGLFGTAPPAPIQASPMAPTAQGGPQGLAQLVQQNNNLGGLLAQDDMQRKQRRQQLLAMMGGRYGTA